MDLGSLVSVPVATGGPLVPQPPEESAKARSHLLWQSWSGLDLRVPRGPPHRSSPKSEVREAHYEQSPLPAHRTAWLEKATHRETLKRTSRGCPSLGFERAAGSCATWAEPALRHSSPALWAEPAGRAGRHSHVHLRWQADGWCGHTLTQGPGPRQSAQQAVKGADGSPEASTLGVPREHGDPGS